MQVSLKLASPLRGGSGRGMEESRGKTYKLARYSVCSKQPNALLKIFPLRACSFLNVVIMQNVFLPLFPYPLPVCLLQTSIAAAETFRNLEESLAQLCWSIAVRGPVDSPSFPGLDTHSRIFSGTQCSPTWSHLSPGQWEAAPHRDHACEPIMTQTSRCFLVLSH